MKWNASYHLNQYLGTKFRPNMWRFDSIVIGISLVLSEEQQQESQV